MTFELVRLGWPNTAAVLVLAVVPLMTLGTANKVGGDAQNRLVEAAASACAMETQNPVTLASVRQETIIE